MSVGIPKMVGFSKSNGDKVEEYLPHNEQFKTTEGQRAIFFSLYNHYIEKEMRLTKKEIANGHNIYEVFKNKMESLSSSLDIYQKFFNLIHTEGETKLLFDVNDMFLHLVYERAKKVNSQAKISLAQNGVIIRNMDKNISPVLLLPTYLKLDKSLLESQLWLKKQLKEACRTLMETEIKQIYLIYPKHPSFTKHISVDLNDQIKLQEEEYRVKMIPYSFSFCTKKQNKFRN